MSKAFDKRKSTDHRKVFQKKANPRKQLFNRLKLLDSIGKTNPSSKVGSIRLGYTNKLNKSIENAFETPHQYSNYLNDDDPQLQSFDGSPSKARQNKFFKNDPKTNISLPNSLEVELANQRLKDYTSISTTMSSVDKKLLESKHKIQSLLELRNEKCTPTSNHSLMSPDFFGCGPENTSNSGFTPMSHSKLGIRIGKVKKKETVTKEIIAREIDMVNEMVDPAFQYFHSDLEELNQHSAIQKKVSEWGNSISPNFLLGYVL